MVCRARLREPPDHGPRPPEQPPRDALDRRDPVRHRGVLGREDGDRDPPRRAAQDGGLVDQGAAPGALEQDIEDGPRGARDPPALLRHDRAEQAVREDAMGGGQHVVEPIEQPRLIGRRHARVEQRAAHREPPHAGSAPDRPQAGVADDGVDGDRSRVVRAADHRRELRAGAAVDRRVRAQVSDEQQRLDEARRRRAARRPPSAHAAPGVDDRERHVAAALGGEAHGGPHPGRGRRDGRRGRRLRRRARRRGQRQGEHGGSGPACGHASRSWAAG
jgi:hypothetical protein